MNKLLLSVFIFIGLYATAQTALSPLTVEKIMRDPKWIGSSPSSAQWGADGKLYFLWNPEKSMTDSLYNISKENNTPTKTTVAQKQALLFNNDLNYNNSKTACVYSKDGDVYLKDLKTGKVKRITQTSDAETNPQFGFNETEIIFSRSQNLFAWNMVSGETRQLTNFVRSSEPPKPTTEKLNTQEQWLKNDQLQNMQVLKERKEKKDAADLYNKSLPKKNELRSIYIDDKNLSGLNISPDGRFVTYRLIRQASSKTTIVPSYVTETGFTTDINGRTKVGSQLSTSENYIYDKLNDTVILVKTDSIPGIKDLPDYVKDYPKQLDERTKKNTSRSVIILGPYWSDEGTNAVVDIRSQDNKDRWLMQLDATTGKLTLLDRQRDEAWIGGPGIGGSFGGGNTGWINENTFWFQSEASGYSHLYSINVSTKEKKALTAGKYEVLQAQLSNDKKFFYITTNEAEPGQQQFYHLPVSGGKAVHITTMVGANQVVVSQDEKQIAILYSYSNKPWELYLQDNKAGAKPQQITTIAQSAEFKTYAWREPELINITARDGASIYARLYKPINPDAKKPAVIFVHGAGYLQNAHKWWSSYFREYMFNNLLVDNGYYVLDIDYRGSAGYGRDWRTGIYRFMGGKDLTDHIDAARYLTEKFGVDAQRIGIYGGSYGGFITLMGLFTSPGTFRAGAALRPVTDWAHYNHGYTSNILNEPFNDSVAYRKSSPIYYADGLKDRLLICHGMVDVNVHFQDVVRLQQRLIELGKNNWELAMYPMEDHGFVEPSSWTDEYKRIFKLFEEVLKK